MLDTNISHIKASSSASLDDKADDNLTSELSKHERKKGGYNQTDYILISNIAPVLYKGENVSVILNQKSNKMAELVKYFPPKPKSRQEL